MAAPLSREEIAARVQAAAEWLEQCIEDRGLLAHVDTATRERLLVAAGRLSRPDRHERKALAREHSKVDRDEKRQRDENLLARTGIRQLRENPIFLTPRRRALHAGQAPAQLAAYDLDAAARNDAALTQYDALPNPASADTASPLGHYDDATAPKPAAALASPGHPAPPPGVAEEAVPPSPGRVSEERLCYCCRAPYVELHHFYDQLCPSCGDLNFAKRDPQADLRGRVALVTGARVKIGYHAAILLLRSGCRVIVVTRFPHDAARRYAAEEDFADWGDRLQIYGVDLRHTPSVERFCQHLLSTLGRLDFIINNACQTVRRPPGFYDHLIQSELNASELTPAERQLVPPIGAPHPALGTDSDPTAALSTAPVGATVSSAMLSQLELLDEDRERGNHLFPEGQLDADLQQVDLRTVNSWRLRLAEVPTVELLEVQLVNAVAPFILNARLKPLMTRVPTADKHIVNVSAMEGQFYRVMKNDRHPHTNMAKAALNMMTRTAAMDYVRDGIHMNSVDTGWVTDEDPAEIARMKREMHRFHPPLDIVDGAARIVDPIFEGIRTGQHVWGQFLKDYTITDW